jgi:N-acetylmuramoyl-L-alanine amidase
MRVVDQRLFHDDGFPCPFVPSPNISGPLTSIDFVIIHFTEGQSAQAAVNVLAKKSSKRSAHLVIARDGSITQLVPFHITAWHAGPSAWKGRVGLAPFSIGIELDNAGPLVAHQGRWVSTFGKAYPPDQVFRGPHKFGGRYKAWHTFPFVQVEAAVEAVSALVGAYGQMEILGHDDIAPKRKWDPGPAFPLELLRGAVFARTVLAPRVG